MWLTTHQPHRRYTRDNRRRSGASSQQPGAIRIRRIVRHSSDRLRHLIGRHSTRRPKPCPGQHGECVCTVDQQANTSAATIPLALGCRRARWPSRQGDLVMLRVWRRFCPEYRRAVLGNVPSVWGFMIIRIHASRATYKASGAVNFAGCDFGRILRATLRKRGKNCPSMLDAPVRG